MVILSGLFGLALLAATFFFVQGFATDRLEAQARSGAQSRVQALESILSTQRAVSAILSDDTTVLSALVEPTAANRDAVSRKLDRLRDETQSAVIYLLDRRGIAVAASNWDEPVSFVGQNYGFRDYFTGALRDTTALQFALGTVSHRPGLYLSHVVLDSGAAVGVVVVKVEFDALEASWAASPDAIFVTAADGTVLLSGSPGARFSPLPAPGRDSISVSVDVPDPGWQLTVRIPSAPALQSALLATGTAGLALATLAYGLERIRRTRRREVQRTEAERRYRADLEQAVQDRTRDLSEEMRERQAAEQRLALMQADLVQANKLATLGQITAGVAHEVNQPLAAIRLLAENGIALLPANGPKEVKDNLGSIVRMAERIGKITTELRGFSRKATGRIEPVSLKAAVDASLLLAASRSRSQNIRIELPELDSSLKVMVEAVRLEQILVNLIQNAQEAVAQRSDPWIRIAVQRSGNTVTVSIEDNGPGLSPEMAQVLFTPFSTSKPDGVGLGLVIAQEISRDFGGELRLAPSEPGRGAVFLLTLPVAE